MSKQICFDFYQVQMPPDAAGSFESIVRSVIASPSDRRRNVNSGDPYRLQRGQSWGRCVEAEMVRIRMDKMPVKASLSGVVEVFDFEDDEGVGEETAFLYDPAIEVLVLQRNRFGMSGQKLARYFEAKGGLDGPILLAPVLHRDAIRRLSKMRTISKFEIKCAGLRRGHQWRGQGLSVMDVVNLGNHFEAPTVEVTLSMGHQRGSLNVQSVKAAIRNAIGLASEQQLPVEKLWVKGVNDEDERDAFDLLEFRMTETAELEMDDRRHLSYAVRRDALRAAWQARSNELNAMFARAER